MFPLLTAAVPAAAGPDPALVVVNEVSAEMCVPLNVHADRRKLERDGFEVVDGRR